MFSRTSWRARWLSGGTGSSYHIKLIGSRALPAWIAVATSKRPWASTISSYSGPTASRMACSHSTASLIICGVSRSTIDAPWKGPCRSLAHLKGSVLMAS